MELVSQLVAWTFVNGTKMLWFLSQAMTDRSNDSIAKQTSEYHNEQVAQLRQRDRATHAPVGHFEAKF